VLCTVRCMPTNGLEVNNALGNSNSVTRTKILSSVFELHISFANYGPLHPSVICLRSIRYSVGGTSVFVSLTIMRSRIKLLLNI
jgi:hypothetical protein